MPAVGQLLAIVTAVLWAGSATCFEAAGRRIGSVLVNLWRLSIAVVLLGLLCRIRRGTFWPTDATAHVWTWLLVSGGLGFFVCDLCLFRAFVLLGARRGTLLLSLAPVIAAVLDAVALRRPPTPLQGVGMAVTLTGVLWVIAERPDDETPVGRAERRTGTLLGFVAALTQALSATTAKLGMRLPDGHDYDAMAATFIRALAGLAGFALLVVVTGRTRAAVTATRDRRAMAWLSAGAVVGPVLGVTCFLASLQHVPAGVTQTIIATIPVLLLPVAYFYNHERVTGRAVAGAAVAVSGVVVLCLT